VRIFLINLARATERLDKMDRQFKVLGIAYERLDATDGASISEADRAMVDDERRKRFTEYPLSDNEIGCWLSHRHAMLTLLESGEEMAAVVEDDADLSPDFAAVLKAVAERKPQFDFIFLHRKFKKGEKFYPCMKLLPGLHLGVVGYAHMGAIAYIVSREGAKKFISYTPRFVHAVDKEIHRYWANGLKVYGLERPVVVTSDGGYSYIEETRLQDNNKPTRFRYHDSHMLSQRLMRRFTRISESVRKHVCFYFYLHSLKRENAT